MKELRQALLCALIGTTGTGKTSTLCQMAKKARRDKVYNYIIGFDPHDVLKKEKILDLHIKPGDEYFAERLMQKDKKGNYKFYNSCLILDDYRSILTGNHTPSDVLDLLMLRRKLSMDIFYVCHNPKLVLEKFSYYTNMYVIFKTESTASDFSDRIPHYYACQKAAISINKYVRNFGRGTYPNFPHCIINTESDELNYVNVDLKKLNKLYDNA